MHMRKGMIRFVIIIIGMLVLFMFQMKSGIKDSETDSEYYQKTNLKFNGIVKKVKPLASYKHDYGVILIDLGESNIEHYDPRENLDRFLGIIKEGKVDLVFNQISNVKIGDSIDFCVQEFKIYRKGKLIRESVTGMPPDDVFKPFKEVLENIDL